MPKIAFTTTEAPLSERLKGDYVFEVIGVDFGISTSRGVTNGSDLMELKLKFFADATFSKPLAQWTETLYFHESCDWKICQFLVCANFKVGGRIFQKGDDTELTTENVVGLRGWASVSPEMSNSEEEKKKPEAERKRYNRVQVFITNKEKLAPNQPAKSAAKDGDDDLPF